MVRHILPLIPEHQVYTECFFGGGAILFAKPPSTVEVINDLNDQVMNFYRVIQTDFEKLQKLVKATLHSRSAHEQAWVIYKQPKFHNKIIRAWAFWTLCNQGFASKVGSSWGYDKTTNSVAKKIRTRRELFGEELKERVSLLQIECADAVKVIETRDCEGAFHYVDPPYFNSNCGHYAGYTEADFERLLACLNKVKGKFLLSSYPSEVLSKCTEKQGWSTKEVEQSIAVSAAAKGKKIEVLTANYPI
jgi:DNA adenine methylase